ncbi:hypothetical protein KUH03_03530 [Sphingobacterium sp. E70]|uniref:hypothetical protein n=1 Tax=Sphingobacterium sp. E70 TaxID=2853439 RepID=UPI00211C9D94|nr:hypothetical protein [Sphingobacterium sp. E70]ULT26054.1 hypothetical protein KUH03_03530 [Sphingobacterium sp. E70]
MPLEKAMSVLLKDKPISWSFKDNMLVVTAVKANNSAVITPTNYAFMLQTRTVKEMSMTARGSQSLGQQLLSKEQAKQPQQMPAEISSWMSMIAMPYLLLR